MQQLKDKVALVTGFGSGLGRAIAVCFAREGCAVAGTSTTASRGEETLGLIRAEGGTALFMAADVRQSDQMKAVVAATVERYGGLDIVVHSAGVRTNGAVTEITEEDWDRTLDTNLKGVFNVCRHAIPEMARRGGGVIINIAARSGMMGQAGRAAYCASKGGIMSLLCRFLPSFDVESSILLAVVGGTTVAVIGLVLAVIRGLFKDPDPPAPNTPHDRRHPARGRRHAAHRGVNPGLKTPSGAVFRERVP